MAAPSSASGGQTPPARRSSAAYHLAALRDMPRISEAATPEELNRYRDRLLLRAPLSELEVDDDDDDGIM